MDSLDEIILTTLADVCNIDRSALTLDTTLTDVGFDSLSAAAFASEMESSYGIPIEPDDLAKLYEAVTPGDVIAVVHELRVRAAETGAVAAT